MNRLTKRLPFVDNFAVLSDEIDGKLYLEQVVNLLATRLADYEDLGYEPEEIKALKSSFDILREETRPLIKAKIDGKLMFVPKLGDFVYEADPEHGVITHQFTDVHWVANTTAVDDKGKFWFDQWTDEDISTAFEKKEDAATKVNELRSAGT